MLNDATLKIRVPSADLEIWRGKAAEAGMSLSEWIRAHCNEESAKWVKGTVASELRIDLKPIAKSVPTAHKNAKTCTHGKAKGENCWQCGGMAKIE